ncbi:type II toxin-antitoxin system RelE/ParE family toxin [Sphingomonas sp. H39-1-10]|uniref:type II toxin-antitoxin system RelE/ParE family toxin n=1 Tax=Sphingomonas pollutisoli TaxID=3030829 RepID=UPI0023BA35C0|nr:type II toxin-antitoxin system RelE/ParE family toxin [Sphingomonas pollutisoli]MDF0490692.1 type II toxin-antitoxin system RelE/ParE family toxin [Sphingomonas pollutisoli]
MAYRVKQTEEFERWLDGITDPIAQKAIVRRIIRVEGGLFGDVKSLGSGLSEMRIDVGQGYRVYYTVIGNAVVFMLYGGTKSTQRRDISKAKEMAGDIE